MGSRQPRHSDRVARALQVEISGTEISGRNFIALAVTILVSRHGAMIVTDRKLAPPQPILIRNLDTCKETEGRVVGHVGEQPDGHVYAVALLNPGVNLWEMNFPPVPDSEPAARILLECASCRTTEEAHLDEIELDVFRVNNSLTRTCRRCDQWTTWEQAAEKPAAARAATAPAPPKNRRKHARVKRKVPGCVRQRGSGEEVVEVEDMSRSGLSFTSRKTYFQGAEIEIAVPYDPRAANIFVPARVVRVDTRPGKGICRYGAAYLEPGKS